MTESSLYIALRTLAERVSRRVVLKRRLPPQYGNRQVVVSPGSMLKMWWPHLEWADKALFEWASEFVRAGDTIWDIGANVGLFTFAAASIAGEKGNVVAVEADIWLAHLLQESVALPDNRALRVAVIPAAIGAFVDLGRLNVAMRGRAANFLDGAIGSSQAGGVRETHYVITVTLDWLLEHLPAPRVVKIDIEGAEDKALEGAMRMLSQVRPVILCEVGTKNAQSVTEMLHAHGYTLYNLTAGGQRTRVPVAVFNTLALPPS